MKHFPDEDWVDWARGTAPEEKRRSMQTHLDSGCSECQAAQMLWSRLAEVGAREKSYEPPASVVRAAKAAFGVAGPAPKPGLIEAIKLVFDSFAQPVPQGIRGGSGARQLVYRGQGYCVDLQLDAQANTVSVVGQIVEDIEPARPLANIAVSLNTGAAPQKQTKTNEFGEFHMDCTAAGPLRIQFAVGSGPALEIPLPAVRPGSRSSTLRP